MKYTSFGKTGLRVSQIALGTGNFGTGWGHGANADDSTAVFNHYAEAGGNFIDTADIYQLGQSDTVSSPDPDGPKRRALSWGSEENLRKIVA
ncbi:aldo/keto reductase [Rhizobium sp. 9140]|uniref:aldo/keto reductase n=1 Tax=Rhizobium sp. 9140 TaxID=1761900 RepID=UPI001FD8876D|nr:aldo/keto reductase [Rhizobium sp. 9140]